MLVLGVFIGLAILLILTGFPLFVSFGIAGFGMIFALGTNPGFAMPCIFTNLNSFVLMAIPFFIFAGGLMTAAGISERIVEFAHSITGRMKGGLGFVTIISCAIFGAISGSSSAAVASIGMTVLPEMEKYGYKKSYATALVACSGVLGQLIPPSIPMIIFGMITGTSVAACFLAEVIPGVLIIFSYAVINFVYCYRRPEIKVQEKLPLNKNLKRIGVSTRKASFALLSPVIVLGGIYGGIFTPTEAGCVSAVYAVIVGLFIYRRMTVKTFMEAAALTASIEGAITFIICFLFVMTRIFTYERLPDAVAHAIFSISSNPVVILLLINLFMVLLGMLVDDISAMLLAAPLLYPVFMQLGVSPLQMAAIMAVNQGCGQMTPPVATNLFTAARISGLQVSEFLGEVFPFLAFGSLPVALLTTFIPELSLWLPRLIMGSP
jgi:C4-dicarboxylate transporter DctM subunit